MRHVTRVVLSEDARGGPLGRIDGRAMIRDGSWMVREWWGRGGRGVEVSAV